MMSDVNAPRLCPRAQPGRKHMWARLEVVEKQITAGVITNQGQEKGTRSKNRWVPMVDHGAPSNKYESGLSVRFSIVT